MFISSRMKIIFCIFSEYVSSRRTYSTQNSSMSFCATCILYSTVLLTMLWLNKIGVLSSELSLCSFCSLAKVLKFNLVRFFPIAARLPRKSLIALSVPYLLYYFHNTLMTFCWTGKLLYFSHKRFRFHYISNANQLHHNIIISSLNVSFDLRFVEFDDSHPN